MKPVFVFTVQKLSRTFLFVTIMRLLNAAFRLFNLGCVANRYSGSVSFYSLKKDNELYEDNVDRSSLLLNIGAGGFKHPRWTNVDLPSNNFQYSRLQGKPNRDFIPFDLAEAKSLPFRTSSIAAIYTSHCVEHLTFDVVNRRVRDFYRVLLPGGILRISCPDAELYASMCISTWRCRQSLSIVRSLLGDIHAFLIDLDDDLLTDIMCKADTGDELLAIIGHLNTEKPFLNRDPSNHISWWTRESLTACLQDAGFAAPLISVVGKSSFPPMTNQALFDTTLPEISILLEAVKTTKV